RRHTRFSRDWSSDVCSSDLAHRGNIGTAGGAASHHAGDLRNTLRAHIGLVEEDAPEMVAVWKNLGLVRQVRAAAVDKIDARQPEIGRASCREGAEGWVREGR